MLSGSTISTLNRKSIAVEFSISKVEEKKPSNTDTILVDFNRFQLNTNYINTTDKATVTVTAKLETGDKKEVSRKLDIPEGGKINREDLGDALPILIENINTSKETMSGSIEITVNHPDLSQRNYKQNFEIRIRYKPMVASGGDTVYELVDQGSSVITEFQLNDGETLDQYDGTRYRVHAFTNTGSNSFTVEDLRDSSGQVEVLTVGGGGGGGGSGGGGGGAGELLFKTKNLAEGTKSIKVGSGGQGGFKEQDSGRNGEDSSFGLTTAIGGGSGGTRNIDSGSTGGSGGGGNKQSLTSGGSSSTGGNDGGNGENYSLNGAAGGGGGAGEKGQDQQGRGHGGDGGDGLYYGDKFGDGFGDNGWFAGGGGGSLESAVGTDGNDEVGSGGKGGGGKAADGRDENGNIADSGKIGEDGQANTGGGGGGGNQMNHLDSRSVGDDGIGGNGGSGIVIIRYPLEEV